MEFRQQELQDKLNELKQYEEEQKNLFMMKNLLTDEQIKMCEILGLSVSNYLELSGNVNNNNDKVNLDELLEQNEDNDDESKINIHDSDPNDSGDSDDSDNEVSNIQDYNNELVSNDIEIPVKKVIQSEDVQSEVRDVVKRPFLKRGAGLASRFKMEPDKFNLKHLPRYKYLDRVKNTLSKQSSVSGKFHESNAPKRESTITEATKKPPKKKENKKVERENHKSIEHKQQESVELVIPNANLKVPEISRKIPSPPPLLEKFTRPLAAKFQTEIKETPKISRPPKGVSWAQMLSSNNISDCSIDINQILNPIFNNEDLDDTSLFQLLEEKINNLNLDSTPSNLIRLLESLQNNEKNSDEDNTLVNPDDPIIDLNTVKLTLHPLPNEINKKIIIDDDDDDDETSDDQEEKGEDEHTNENESEHRVRFSQQVEIADNDDCNSSILSSDLEAVELSQTSTPNTQLKFQQFKRQMLGVKKVEKQADDLKEKAEMLTTKLKEIEKEKANIMKIKSELELDKIQLEHDRDDAMERMRDEKIKMEMEIHDERLKIDQQKQKLDKMIREAKVPSKKEREEVVKLKETIEELKDEIKNKDVKHASSLSRFRSQIKLLEKENQTLKLELEAEKKDNKKLELENARLKRETNSKMLQEINRNIAKLAQPEASNKIEANKKTEAKKVEPVRRKSEPINRKKVQVPPVTPKENSSDSSDEENEVNLNPIRTRISDPVIKSASTSTSSDILGEMKREILNSDGSKDIWYPNGNLKKISPDGMNIRMLYYNKDIKETNINEGTVKYYYAENNTWHTTYIDGLEILEYPNGQIEHRYKDGTIEIHYTDGSIRITNKNWVNDVKEEWKMPDGANAKIYKNDTKIFSFPNGQREVHTLNHKRREYPDGTVKIMYEDGTMETRYSNGRIRVKDKDGNLTSDSMAK